jgi:phosphoserine phosphatase
MARPLLLFDLDGTVIDVNSFPIWVKELLLARGAHLGVAARLSVATRAAAALAVRKLLRQSHARFKQRLQRIWSTVEAAAPAGHAADALVERLAGRVRPNLGTLLGEVASGGFDAVLTTAAAAEYAVPLASRLGFRHVVATPAGGGVEATDNVGAVKRDRTLAYLRVQGWAARPRILFTDHRDDLPLIHECGALVWFGAAADCAAIARQEPAKPTIAALGLSPAAVRACVDTILPTGTARG